MSVTRLRGNLAPTSGFLRPTFCGDFAVNFSKETRDRVDAHRYINGCEQLADQPQRCALFAQLDDAIFQRHQLCVTHRWRRRECANSVAKTLRARCDVGRLAHRMHDARRGFGNSLGTLRGKASLPKIFGFIHRSSLIRNAVTGSADGATQICCRGIRVMCSRQRRS